MRSNRHVRPGCTEERFVACHLTAEGAEATLRDLFAVATEVGIGLALTNTDWAGGAIEVTPFAAEAMAFDWRAEPAHRLDTGEPFGPDPGTTDPTEMCREALGKAMAFVGSRWESDDDE